MEKQLTSTQLSVKKIEKIEYTLDILKQNTIEFEELVQTLEYCKNENISDMLLSEKTYFKAKDKSYEIKQLETKFKTIQKYISIFPELSYLTPTLNKIRSSFNSPVLRIQKIYFQKQLNKTLQIQESGIPTLKTITIGSKKSTTPFNKGHINSRFLK